MKWNIIADSCCDLFELEKNYDNITYKSVPIIINIDGEEFSDDENLDTQKMTQAMKNSKKTASTACPSPSAWYESTVSDEYNILVTVTKELSGCYNSAALGVKMFEENGGNGKAAIIDCCATGPAAVLTVRKIANLIQSGKDFESVVSQTEKYVASMNTVFALSCFDNLIKSGRMSKFTGILAASLDFRGVGVEEHGKIKFKDKVRGKRKMIESIKETMIQNSFGGKEAVISHCHNEELAQKLSEEIKEVYPEADITLLPTRGLNSFYAEEGGIIVSYT